jgi:hypothetical protein
MQASPSGEAESTTFINYVGGENNMLRSHFFCWGVYNMNTWLHLTRLLKLEWYCYKIFVDDALNSHASLQEILCKDESSR